MKYVCGSYVPPTGPAPCRPFPWAPLLRIWPEAVALAERIAVFPETSGEERRACAWHVAALRRYGFRVETGFLGMETAFCATRGRGPRVDLLAEYDALPVIGHGCGHHLNGAMSFLAAATIASSLPEDQGTLRVLGTPAEETWGSKTIMANRGIFVDSALVAMVHAGSAFSLVRYRSSGSRTWRFLFRSTNEAGAFETFQHASDHVPRSSWQLSRSSETTVDLTVWGGPSRIQLVESLLRTHAASVALPGAWAVVPLHAPLVPFRPCPAAEDAAEELLRQWGVPFLPTPREMGASDIGAVSVQCPTVHAILAAVSTPVPWHTSTFARLTRSGPARESIALGARLLVALTLKAWEDPSFRQAISASWKSAQGSGERPLGVPS